MPEDKPETTSQADASTQNGSAPDTDNAEGSLFDNMTSEEQKSAFAEKAKSFDELHAKMGQMSGELGELRSFRKESEGESKLASAVSAVKDLVAEKEKKPELDYEAFEAQILEEAAENPGEAMKKFMRVNSSWADRDKAELKAEHEKEMGDIKSQISVLAEAYQTTTPDYQENKELIEKFRGKGMSIADAKVMAKEIRDMLPESQRTTPPSGVDTSRTVIPERKQTEARYSVEEIADMKARMPEEVVEALIQKAERDSGLTAKQKEDF
jgi:hypothetical protein